MGCSCPDTDVPKADRLVGGTACGLDSGGGVHSLADKAHRLARPSSADRTSSSSAGGAEEGVRYQIESWPRASIPPGSAAAEEVVQVMGEFDADEFHSHATPLARSPVDLSYSESTPGPLALGRVMHIIASQKDSWSEAYLDGISLPRKVQRRTPLPTVRYSDKVPEVESHSAPRVMMSAHVPQPGGPIPVGQPSAQTPEVLWATPRAAPDSTEPGQPMRQPLLWATPRGDCQEACMEREDGSRRMPMQGPEVCGGISSTEDQEPRSKGLDDPTAPSASDSPARAFSGTVRIGGGSLLGQGDEAAGSGRFPEESGPKGGSLALAASPLWQQPLPLPRRQPSEPDEGEGSFFAGSEKG